MNLFYLEPNRPDVNFTFKNSKPTWFKKYPLHLSQVGLKMPGRPILLDVPKRAFLYYFAENSLEKKKKKNSLFFVI